MKEAQERFTAGKATRADVLEVEVKLLETKQKLSKAQADFQVALSGLKKLTGLEGAEEIRLTSHYPLQDIKNRPAAAPGRSPKSAPFVDLSSGR